MTFDVKTATDAELAAKQRWYEARGTRFIDQIVDIANERQRREREAHAVQNVEQDLDDAAKDEAAEQRADDSFIQDEVQLDEGTKASRSVVHPAYRQRYAERGNKRGCGDWLHRLLDELCLVQGKLDVAFFESLLTANSVKHEHWNRTTPGWQGRLRMSGRVALAGVLKRNGFVATPEGMRCAPQAGE